MDVDLYLSELISRLFSPTNWKQIVLTRQWIRENVPDVAGVYAFKENDHIVYAGETGNLQGRINDLIDSRRHTLRRTIGKKFFSTINGFIPATERIKFPPHIELLVNNHICTNLLLAYLVIPLGRKELEEIIIKNIASEIRLNKRGKRITK